MLEGAKLPIGQRQHDHKEHILVGKHSCNPSVSCSKHGQEAVPEGGEEKLSGCYMEESDSLICRSVLAKTARTCSGLCSSTLCPPAA